MGELRAKLMRTKPCRCGGRRRGRRARLRRPWAVARPGRALNQRIQPHISDTAPLVWRAPEGPEGTGEPPDAGPGRGAGGRRQSLARQHTDTPTDWRPPRGLRGLAGLRDDAPSEARGADGSRAGRPRGGRRSVGATSSAARTRAERNPYSPRNALIAGISRTACTRPAR